MENYRVLIYGIHRTSQWWSYLGRSLELGEAVVVTDLRGEGDISVVDDFYRELKRLRKMEKPDSGLMTESETLEIIARCRLLRWLDVKLSAAMVHAMAIAFDRVLDRFRPAVVLSFPIDRYVSDVLARRAAARGVPYLELTAAVFSGMSMLLHRGKLLQSPCTPDASLIETKRKEIASPVFVPSYVSEQLVFNRFKFIRTLAYFKARAIAFKLISWIKRDPLNLHYMDSQQFLGHKCRWKDIRVVNLVDRHWRNKLDGFDQEKRIFFGLQLFPEASIDYWIQPLELIDHENLVVEAVQAFSEAGYLVLVKDHPLQFGFRHTDLIQRMLLIKNVVLVPYEVPGNELVSISGVNFTCTGTLGLQSALAGKKSVVTDSYYSNEEDFIVFRSRDEIHSLPARVESKSFSSPLEIRQQRIVEHLMKGSFDGDIFTFKGFDKSSPSEKISVLAKSLRQQIINIVDGTIQ